MLQSHQILNIIQEQASIKEYDMREVINLHSLLSQLNKSRITINMQAITSTLIHNQLKSIAFSLIIQHDNG